jgi:hypothetical protein
LGEHHEAHMSTTLLILPAGTIRRTGDLCSDPAPGQIDDGWAAECRCGNAAHERAYLVQYRSGGKPEPTVMCAFCAQQVVDLGIATISNL